MNVVYAQMYYYEKAQMSSVVGQAKVIRDSWMLYKHIVIQLSQQHEYLVHRVLQFPAENLFQPFRKFVKGFFPLYTL